MASVSTYDEVIEALHAVLDARLVEAGGTAIPYGIGRIAKGLNDRSPRIIWDDSANGGQILPVKGAGGNPHPIYRDTRSFEVSIWSSTREAVQGNFHNLLAALAYSDFGRETVSFADKYEISPGGSSRAGFTIKARASLTLIVTKDIWTEVSSPEFEGVGVMIPSGEPYEDD